MANDAGGDRVEFGSQKAGAEWWGCGIRTFERWIARGAPMDRPGEIPGWYAKWAMENHGQKRKEPRWVADALERWKGGKPVEMENRPEVPDEMEAEARRAAAMSPMESVGNGMDFEEQVRRQRLIVNAHYQRLVGEYRRGTDITVHERRYQAALEQLRKMEKDAAKLKIEAGRAWDREEVRAVVKDMVNALNGGLDYLHARLEKRLQLTAEQVAVVKEVSSELKQQWRENRLGLEVGS
jgi:hypothetical protein